MDFMIKEYIASDMLAELINGGYNKGNKFIASDIVATE